MKRSNHVISLFVSRRVDRIILSASVTISDRDESMKKWEGQVTHLYHSAHGNITRSKPKLILETSLTGALEGENTLTGHEMKLYQSSHSC
jgi:hypothetical protein